MTHVDSDNELEEKEREDQEHLNSKFYSNVVGRGMMNPLTLGVA
jgi:hypothetical protein